MKSVDALGTVAATPSREHAARAASRARLRNGALILVFAIFVLGFVPGLVGTYWTFLLTGGVIAIPIMQSLGVITGRVGVMSLCQLSFAIIGAWVVGWCNVHDFPGGFYVWMLLGGLAAVPAGLIVGFPALRVRGVNLAIATFALATAVDVIFSSKQFPGADNFEFVARPSGFDTDPGYFRFVVLVAIVLFLVLAFIDRTRLGASWVELRYSERGAAAHGTNVAMAKLAAFAVSAFIAGIGGALIVGQTGVTTQSAFTAGTSLFVFSIAVTIGVQFWDAAVIAGLLGSLVPVLLDKIHLASDFANIIFGVVAVMVLASGKGQMGQAEIIRARRHAKQARERLERTGSTATQAAALAPETLPSTFEPVRTQAAANGAPVPALEIRELTVKFGAVTAVDDVSLTLAKGGVIALLGPNGAGKSTLINAATGFVRGTGSVLLDGRPIDRMSPHRRARLGLRRSFQQLRVAPGLTAGMFLSTAAGRKLSAEETEWFLAWFGCPPAHVPIGTMDVGTRRMLEVAGLAAGAPSVLLLDEPAAGQGARETELLGQRIAAIPKLTGSTVLLVEHDVDLVRAACDSLIVMDFGRVIASGEPDEVLAHPDVVKAYVGTVGAGQGGATELTSPMGEWRGE